jgi:DNA-binding IclR family transcriptional regulator
MSDLGPLLDWMPPAVQSSTTSLAAADAVRPNAATLRALVLRWLEEHGPATDEQVISGTGLSPSTARPRRVELVRAGFVRDSGRTALTAAGRKAALWEVVR